jgi:hypothetical protein
MSDKKQDKNVSDKPKVTKAARLPEPKAEAASSEAPELPPVPELPAEPAPVSLASEAPPVEAPVGELAPEAPVEPEEPMPDDSEFGGSGIVKECYAWIRKHIPKGAVVLELGSGSDVCRLILVDGPPGSENREGFLKHIAMFDLNNAFVIIDNTDRKVEWKVAREVERIISRPLFRFESFSVI